MRSVTKCWSLRSGTCITSAYRQLHLIKTPFLLGGVSWSWAGQNPRPTVTEVPARRVTLALLLSLVECKHWSPQQTIRALTLAPCTSSPPKNLTNFVWEPKPVCGKAPLQEQPQILQLPFALLTLDRPEVIHGGGVERGGSADVRPDLTPAKNEQWQQHCINRSDSNTT